MQSQQNRMLYVTPDSPEEALDGSFRRMAQELATADSLKVSLLREALAKDLPINIFHDESSALIAQLTVYSHDQNDNSTWTFHK